MPVTLKTAPHGSSIAKFSSGPLHNISEALEQHPGGHAQTCAKIHEGSPADVDSSKRIYANDEGFVGAAIKAYNEHLHLTIRPDDVWIAILTQLSFYINGHAEELRNLFVEHDGQKELKIEVQKQVPGSFEECISKMSELIKREIADPSFRNWVMPTFSTTTDTDRTVCSVVLMGTLKNYFTYTFVLLCGIPSVTLLGDKADWELLRSKLSRLASLGIEPTTWSTQLEQVITGMVDTFDSNKASESTEFWQKIAHRHKVGSGEDYYSGWITAFCFWSTEGKSLYEAQYAQDIGFGETRFHTVDISKVPKAIVEVPVKVIDQTEGREYKACILAGCCAFKGSTSEEASAKGSTGIDTVQPVPTWLIYEKKPDSETSGSRGDVDEAQLAYTY